MRLSTENRRQTLSAAEADEAAFPRMRLGNGAHSISAEPLRM
jgi:hypothetical protein